MTDPARVESLSWPFVLGGPLLFFQKGPVSWGLAKAVHVFTVFYGIPCRGKRFSTREPSTQFPRQAALCGTLPMNSICYIIFTM